MKGLWKELWRTFSLLLNVDVIAVVLGAVAVATFLTYH